MTVSHDRLTRTLHVSQRGYIDKVLDRLEVNYCKPPTTPMSLTYHTARSTDADILSLSDIQQFQSIVESLIYLAIHTRPDLLYSATSLA